MTKKWKFLYLASTALLLAACGNGDTDTEETPDDAAAETEEVAEETPDDEEEGTEDESAEDPFAHYPAIDMGGRTIKVATWWDYFYDSRHSDPTEDPGASNLANAQMEIDNIRRIEEKYNVRIEYENLGWDGVIDSINTSVIAGTPDFDIYTVDLQFGLAPAMNGYALSVDEFAPEYADIIGDQEVITPLDTFGEEYLFAETAIPQSSVYMMYNATMLEELGLEDPWTLMENGEWTWEKFAELAEAATRDTDGDGNVDVYGYGGAINDTAAEFVASNGGTIADTLEEGLSSAETVEALEFIYNMYHVDNFARPYTDDWDDQYFAWQDGRVAFNPIHAWALIDGPDLSYDYRIVRWPQGPNGDGVTAGQNVGNHYFIPRGVEDPQAVYQIFEEFKNWYAYDIDLRENYDWFEQAFTSVEDMELALDIGANVNNDLWRYADTSGSVGGALWNIAMGEMTVSQAVESNRQIIQDDLDNFRAE